MIFLFYFLFIAILSILKVFISIILLLMSFNNILDTRTEEMEVRIKESEPDGRHSEVRLKQSVSKPVSEKVRVDPPVI